MGRGGLPPGAGVGYVYDWLRQRQRRTEEQKKRNKKLRKKIRKLTKGRRKNRRKGPHITKRTNVKVKKNIEEEERHRERTKQQRANQNSQKAIARVRTAFRRIFIFQKTTDLTDGARQENRTRFHKLYINAPLPK